MPLEAAAARAGRSSDVPWGVSEPMEPSVLNVMDGARRCLLRYEADRGSGDRGPLEWMEDRRLESGEFDADEAGDRCDGGV
jgi:hypothetical protein